MLLKVTAEHIRSGCQNNCDSCPVALALLEVLKNGYSPDVDGESIGIFDREGDLVQTIAMPEAIQKFVEAFDAETRYDNDGKEIPSAMQPFECELGINPDHLK